MDPKDQVIGQPTERWVWLAPDWSDYDDNRKKANTWTHVVVRETRYADGRIVTQVLDENHQPFPQPLDTSIDTKQQTAFQQQQNNPRQSPQPIPSSGAPTQARKAADGLDHIYGYNPQTGLYDIDQGAVQTQQTQAEPPKEKDQNGRHYVWQPNAGGPNAGGQWVDVGPAPLTPAEQQARAAQQTARIVEPDKAHPGLNVVTTKNPQTGVQETHYEDASGNRVPAPADAPNYSAQQRTINGQIYTTVIATPKDGSPPRITNYDPSGQPVAQLPAEGKPQEIRAKGGPNGEDVRVVRDEQGNVVRYEVIPGQTAPTATGPAMPSIIVGQSQAALRSYYDQLQAEVAAGRQTPAWAQARWNEALQMAQLAVQDAQISERERESNLNANVNLAQTKLQTGMSGLQNALAFVSELNGKLPPGSNLGGEAFAALLGLQMLTAKRSGIYDIQVPPAGTAAREQLTNNANQATATTDQQVARLTDPGNHEAVSAQRQEVAVATADAAQPEPPAEGAAPAPVFRPPPPVPGQTPQPTTAPVPAAPASPAAPAAPSSAPPTPATGLPAVNPATGEPTGLPQTAPPFNPSENPTPGLPRGQTAPGDDFPALASIQTQYAPPVAPASAPPAAPTRAELELKARTTPVWKLSEDEYNQMKAAGIPDELIWSTPRSPSLVGAA